MWRYIMNVSSNGGLLVFILTTVGLTGARIEITLPPTSLNVTVGSFALFTCHSEGGPVNWILNNNPDSSTWGEGVELAAFQQNGQHFRSSIRMLATLDHNNSMIMCSAPGVQSSPALLKIQGLLAAPGSLRILSTDENIIELTWKAPFTLDLSGENYSIMHYLITVRNRMTNNVFRGNTTLQKYLFSRPGDSGPCDMYRIAIVAVNAAGEGDEAVIQSAFKSDINLLHDKQSSFTIFHCNVSCDIFGKILWFINGSLVNFRQGKNDVLSVIERASQQTENQLYCPEDEAGGYYIESVTLTNDLSGPLSRTVYCASIMICNIEDECLPITCFSDKITTSVQDVNQSIIRGDTGFETTTMHDNTMDASCNNSTPSNTVSKEASNMWKRAFIFGVCIALGFILLITLFFICTCVLCVRLRCNQTVRPNWNPPAANNLSLNSKGQSNLESIYEEPTTVLKQQSSDSEIQMMKCQSCPAYEQI